MTIDLTHDRDVVEPDRFLPMLMTRDTRTGVAKWSGTYLVNPWENGKLIGLDAYPRMAQYLESWNGEIQARQTQAQRSREAGVVDRRDRRPLFLATDAAVPPVALGGAC